jgi:hypothetical protein
MILLVLGTAEQVSFFAHLLLVCRLIGLGDFPLWRKRHADTEDIASIPTDLRYLGTVTSLVGAMKLHLLDRQVVSSCFPCRHPIFIYLFPICDPSTF